MSPEKLAELKALGIDPAGAKWAFLKGTSENRTCFAAQCVCWCTGEPWLLSMVPFVTDKRMRIHITQCPHCRKITWSMTHPQEVWTGPVKLEAKSMCGRLDALPSPLTLPRTEGT